MLSYNPINSEVLLHNGGEPYALKGASTVRRGVHAKTCKGCAVPTLQFVARKIWRRRGVSPRRCRAHRLQRREPLRGLLMPMATIFDLLQTVG